MAKVKAKKKPKAAAVATVDCPFPWITEALRPLAVPIVSITPDPNNARSHDERNLRSIAGSLRRFGQVAPLVVNRTTKIIAAGNGRYVAAKQLGWTHVAVVFVDQDAGTHAAYSLADNRTAELADWVKEQLLEQIAAIRNTELSLSEDLFLAELGGRFGEEGPPMKDAEPQIDRADELLKVWKCERGQVWEVPGKAGVHRIMCGDSTKAEDVGRLMGDVRAGLMNTDPPYGVDYTATKDGIPRSGFANIRKEKGDIAQDDLKDEKLQAFLEGVFTAAKENALRQNAAWYLWHAHLTQGFFAAAAAAAAAADVILHRQIIWRKPGFVLTRSGMYHWSHEPCFFGWQRGHQPPWYGDRSQRSVWELTRDGDKTGHPTQKPVELFCVPIRNHLLPAEVCYEPFGGSGSQWIAAENLGRVCYGLEIEPKYVAVILQRCKDIGLSPRLAAS